ncbi:MAG: tRNA (adenosine(37)-N6)-dimethylallyltransferase MiaA [Candidatus Colwellbacteria bacterium CG10_big_fil_rev_8_21_14_0_10_41_28]|uniref:tRNA dimethylallyltransferase n=1 Tax=Candidatus Colwellbacteria bacterium CG10_big_fil_rev_8_21_14_0_10_41_28 TaxID=1974539 RepID=A0A2H0VHH8_9BACT|nr:MAG: tRNA (adenosine(37)-N6)-dimethylallyltransferase MiaA [Candidatus Colwellbacteria bacterium CG10_big_fil_rev_8_21_14_0_10_41_28]
MKVFKKTEQGPKILVILGPTCSGKSELAVSLAKKFNGEVISADSRQVYRGLDKSSSKVPGKWVISGVKRMFMYKGVRHHLVDITPLRRRFTVQQFKKKGKKAIKNILSRGKVPIIAGGTGFYLDALVYDLDIPRVPPNRKLRKELDNLSTDELYNRLKGLDPKSAKRVDPNNRVRIIRAIEIVVMTGSPIPEIDLTGEEAPYETLQIGIKLPEDELKRRIHSVAKNRVNEGVVEEITQLHNKGVSWDRFIELGMEYRHIARYLKSSDITQDELRKALENEFWQYSRRQMVWFRRAKNITWISDPSEAVPIVQDFLSPSA